MVEITGMLMLYHVLMFAAFVAMIRYFGGYILAKSHKPFPWIGSAIAAAVIYVGQMLVGNILMAIGAALFV